MAQNFPTVDEFRLESQDQALKWRDLPLGVYRIISMRETKSKFGAGMLLTLEDIYEAKIKCWACSRLAEQLKEDKEIKFILNEGKKPCSSNPANSYFDFTAIRGADLIL